MHPYISVSFANRNDNYGGYLSQRIQAFIDYYSVYIKRWPGLFEFVITDYNPPSDKPKLRDAFDWSPLGLVVHIEIPAGVHEQIPGASRRKIQDYIARNVGLRQGNGEYGLVLNQDIFMSKSLLEELARRELRPNYFYRTDRCDFHLDLDSLGKSPEVFEHMALANTFVVHRRHASTYYSISKEVTPDRVRHVGSVPEPGDILDEQTNIIYCAAARQKLNEDRKWYYGKDPAEATTHRQSIYHSDFYSSQLKLHTNASGDFVIASKYAWDIIRGFPEDTSFYMWVDSYAIMQLIAAGYDQAIFMQPHRIFHADHDRSMRAGFVEPPGELHEKALSQILRGERSFCFNNDNWGLANYSLPKFA